MLRKRVTFMLLFLTFLIGVTTANAEDASSSPDYPINVDDSKWKELSYSEALELLNVNTEDLSKLDSDELLDLAIRYPFLCDIYGFDDWETGVDNVSRKSTVLTAFWQRDDFAQTILRRFIRILPTEEYLLSVEGYLEYEFLENSLQMQKVLEKLKPCEIEMMKSKMLRDIELIENMKTEFSIPLRMNVFLSEQIGEYSCSASGSTGFVGNGCLVYRFNGARYCEGRYYKYGTSETAYLYVSNDFSTSEKTTQDNAIATSHPTWVKLSSATKKFNCHSYAWLGESTIWLDDPAAFANASTYIQSIGVDCAISGAGEIVTLWDTGISHSMITESASSGLSKTGRMSTTTVRSKLGSLGVYRTSLYDMYLYYSANYYHVYHIR